jgi:uncharacterized protein (DUF1501 family)
MGASALGLGASPTGWLESAARAAAVDGGTLVHIFLRGGADGLTILPPHGDPDYYRLRGAIAIPRGTAHDLDGTLGLHPSLAPLVPLWNRGLLAIVPAAGQYDLTRSHFTAQERFEAGAPAGGPTSGWLGRAVATTGTEGPTRTIALSSSQPRSVEGTPVLVLQRLADLDFQSRPWRTAAEGPLRAMYTGDSPTQVAGREALDSMTALRAALGPTALPAPNVTYPEHNTGVALRQTAQIIKSGLGTRCVFVDLVGAWDSHENQPSRYPGELAALGESLAAFADDLGALMERVCVVVGSEFGRTAAVNGTIGTDHGSATCMMVLGGGIRGGRIYGGYPGLANSQLYEGRDLAVVTDYRDVLWEAARAALGASNADTVFPGYSPRPLGMVR